MLFRVLVLLTLVVATVSSAPAEAGCPVSEIECGGECVDVETDVRHCGGCNQPCATNEVCTNGRCTCCPTPFLICGVDCVDPRRDERHCGSCDVPCAPGEACSSGECLLSCPLEQENCGGTCVDLDHDRAHCGACGRRCDPGEVCSLGECLTSCQLSLENCGGACVDLDRDRAHCGACGRACSSGEICTDGNCVLTCTDGYFECSHQCVDTMKDERHCGGCDIACDPSEHCVDGACRIVCRLDQSECNSTCVDPLTDRNHCGTCGRACAAGQFCIAGMCRAPCVESGLTDCGDGVLDVVVADIADSPLHVLRNNRDSFAMASSLGTPGPPTALATGDADGDGDPDVVAAIDTPAGAKLQLFLSIGNGELSAGDDFDIPDDARVVLLHDLNRDGRLDFLVLTQEFGEVGTLLSQPNASFAWEPPLDVGSRPVDMVLSEFDHDERPDLVVVRADTSDLALWEWVEGGWIAGETIDGFSEPASIGAGRLNNDDFVDLAVAEFGAARVSVLLNDGDGAFADPVPHSTGNRPIELALGLTPGDDLVDIATVDRGDGTITILENDGDGSSFTATPFNFPVPPVRVIAADVNQDGVDDFLALTESDPNIGQGALTGLVSMPGGYEFPPAVPAGTRPVALAIADLVGGTVCIDTDCNRSHCGWCGNVCQDDEWCINGRCRLRTDLDNNDVVDLADYARWILTFFGPKP